MLEVSAYEAKTHLAELLRKVKTGERITITKHNIPIARMMPVMSRKTNTIADTVSALQKFRKGKTLRGLNIKEMKEEGRR